MKARASRVRSWPEACSCNVPASSSRRRRCSSGCCEAPHAGFVAFCLMFGVVFIRFSSFFHRFFIIFHGVLGRFHRFSSIFIEFRRGVRGLAGREEALGSSHPETVEVLSVLTELLQEQGEVMEAEKLYCLLGLSKNETFSDFSHGFGWFLLDFAGFGVHFGLVRRSQVRR